MSRQYRLRVEEISEDLNDATYYAPSSPDPNRGTDPREFSRFLEFAKRKARHFTSHVLISGVVGVGSFGITTNQLMDGYSKSEIEVMQGATDYSIIRIINDVTGISMGRDLAYMMFGDNEPKPKNVRQTFASRPFVYIHDTVDQGVFSSDFQDPFGERFFNPAISLDQSTH